MYARGPSAKPCMPSKEHRIRAVRYSRQRASGAGVDHGAYARNVQGGPAGFLRGERCLEIASEASRRLPASVRDRHPDLPWRAIMDVGNVFRHEYDNVSHDPMWRTVQERLPQLLVAIESEIAALPRSLPADDLRAEPHPPERDAAAKESPEPGEGRPSSHDVRLRAGVDDRPDTCRAA